MGLHSLFRFGKPQLPRTWRMPTQHPVEYVDFLMFLASQNVRSYLEIGSRDGSGFAMVMRALPPGARGVSVDLPEAMWGRSNSGLELDRAMRGLKEMGHDVTSFIGDSRDPKIIAEVQKHAPFDAALIDGDHRYEGVKADWLTYGPMARIVAFHDIVGFGQGFGPRSRRVAVEVPRLWSELKQEGLDTREFIGPNSRMGIGVVLRSP